MTSLGRHLICGLEDRRPIATTTADRRTLATAIFQVGQRYGLAAFSLPDNHLHMWPLCSEAEGSQLLRSVASSLKQRLSLPVGFRYARNDPVRDPRHAANLARYILQNPTRHGVTVDPFREASNLPDLLGLRTMGGPTAENLRRALPRLNRRQLLEWLGVDDLEPADGPLERAVAAGLRAAALPDLKGRSARVVELRRALIRIARGRMTPHRLAEALGVNRRRVFDQASRAANPALVRAIRLQLDLARRLGLQDEPSQAFL